MSDFARTYKAEETATGKNLFMKTGAGERSCLVNDTAGGITIGIAEDDLIDTEGVSVVDRDGDFAMLVMSEACDEGAELKSTNAGEGAVVDENATAELQWIGATALEAASGDNSEIDVRKVGYWKYF